MKKKYYILMAVFICLLVLSGCCLSHDWQEADCETPKTCLKCGKTEGEALGHRWTEASCAGPMTCQKCGKTEGEALEHNWDGADCLKKRVCTVCGTEDSELLGHDWAEATCQVPQICRRCGVTMQNVGDHDWSEQTCEQDSVCRFCGIVQAPAYGHSWQQATCVAPETCYYCGETRGEPKSDNHIWKPATADAPITCRYCGETMGEPIPDRRFDQEASKCVSGLWRAKVSIPTSMFDQDTLPHVLRDIVKKQQTLECWIMIDIYVDARMNMEITPVDWKKITLDYQPDVLQYDFGVYYVEDGTLYIGMDWEQEMTPLVFAVDEEGTSLTLEGNILGPTKDDAYRKERFNKAAENQFYSSFKNDADLGTLTFERIWE